MLRLCVLIGMLSAALCGSDRQLLPEHVLKDAARGFGVSEAAVLGEADTCTRSGHACPAITRLSRRLNRTGFHRLLVTQLDVSAPSPYNQDAVCHVALLQRLPRDVYVDQYEMSIARVTRSRQAGEDAAIVRVFGAYQVERPAPECESSLVAVTVRAERSARQGVVSANAAVPIHARYPAPAQPGETKLRDVDIPVPVALIRCGGEDALWQQAIMADGDKVITWKVPAGDSSSMYSVDAFTWACTYAAAIAVLAVLAANKMPGSAG